MRTTKLTEDFIQTFKISQILEEKPRSGQKQVYIVEIDGIIYALKVISTVDDRIVRELHIYDRFKDNPGIPKIISMNKYGDDLVLLEEFITGDDLNKISYEYVNDSYKVRLLIFKIAKILTPIWEQKCVHRDLKPNNIIIKKNGDPVVLDFGIARDLDDETITPAGFQPYTWNFGSPEQYFFKKELITYRTDFFCLGIIGYYLFTGKLPFGKNRDAIAATFNGQQIMYDVNDREMNEFLNSVLKFSVAERPRTIDQFIKLLCI